MELTGVKDKVVIVTGATRGIGRAIAEVFADSGMKVVCAARSKEQGDALVEEIKDRFLFKRIAVIRSRSKRWWIRV